MRIYGDLEDEKRSIGPPVHQLVLLYPWSDMAYVTVTSEHPSDTACPEIIQPDYTGSTT